MASARYKYCPEGFNNHVSLSTNGPCTMSSLGRCFRNQMAKNPTCNCGLNVICSLSSENKLLYLLYPEEINLDPVFDEISYNSSPSAPNAQAGTTVSDTLASLCHHGAAPLKSVYHLARCRCRHPVFSLSPLSCMGADLGTQRKLTR